MKNYILEGKITKKVELTEWADWFEKSNKVIQRTKISEDVTVSTVFLGVDHSFGGGNPILFETMIFGGEHDSYQERYTTYEKAESGHLEAIKLCGDDKLKNNKYNIIMIILSESVGFNYSQTLKICRGFGDSFVQVIINKKVMYDGVAKGIIDNNDTLRFIDDKGKEHKYYKDSSTNTAI